MLLAHSLIAGSIAIQKSGDHRGADIAKCAITDGLSERNQNCASGCETPAETSLVLDEGGNGGDRAHRSPPKSSSPTWRRPCRSIFVYIRVVFMLRWPRSSEICLKVYPT